MALAARCALLGGLLSRTAQGRKPLPTRSSQRTSSSFTALFTDDLRRAWRPEAVTKDCPCASLEIRPRVHGTDRAHWRQPSDRPPMPCDLEDLTTRDAGHHALEVLLELSNRNTAGLVHV